jgi:hypothetical protein
MFHGKLAVDFARAGRTFEAREHFRAARRLAPESGALAMNWATFSAATGEPELSLHLFLSATRATTAERPALPDQIRLLTLIADSFFAARDPSAAIRTAEAALRLAQGSPERGLAARPAEQLGRFRAAGTR